MSSLLLLFLFLAGKFWEWMMELDGWSRHMGEAGSDSGSAALLPGAGSLSDGKWSLGRGCLSSNAGGPCLLDIPYVASEELLWACEAVSSSATLGPPSWRGWGKEIRWHNGRLCHTAVLQECLLLELASDVTEAKVKGQAFNLWILLKHSQFNR